MLKRLRVFSGQSNHATPSITVKEHIKVITLSRSQPEFANSQVHDWLHSTTHTWHTYIPTQPNPTAPVAPSRLEDAACRASWHQAASASHAPQAEAGSLGKDSDIFRLLPYFNRSWAKLNKEKTRSDSEFEASLNKLGPRDVQQQVL